MTTVVVEEIVSAKEFGVIFAARVVDVADERHGERLRVRTSRTSMIGEPSAGETWQVEGQVSASRWGPQIVATRATRTLPTGKLVRDFLASHVVGIGPDRATRLWIAFETELPKVLNEGDIEAIAEVIAPDRPILSPRLAAACVTAWRKAAGEARLVEWLGAVGMDDIRLTRRLFNILGDRAVDRLASNPWTLATLMPWPRVDALGVKLLRERNAVAVEAAPDRLVGAVNSAIRDVIATGATLVDDAALRSRIADKLDVPIDDDRVARAMALGHLHGAILPLGESWRAPGCAFMESRVTEKLRSMLTGVGHPFAADALLHGAIAEFERHHGALHVEQRLAVESVLRSPLACLQGGAGVGKTFTTRAICEVWERSGGTVLLAALAGKAALRLSRATGRLARTLYRTIKELDERETHAGPGNRRTTPSGGVSPNSPRSRRKPWSSSMRRAWWTSARCSHCCAGCRGAPGCCSSATTASCPQSVSA